MKVLVFPQDANPYQEQLYQPMRKHGLVVTYLKLWGKSYTIGTLLLPIQLLLLRLQGYKIFHLHWTFPFVFPFKGKFWTVLSTVQFFVIITWIKVLRFHIVWTVHNVLPHNPQFLDDILAHRYLSGIVNRKIVHSNATIDQMHLYKYNTENVTVIPIGSFVGVYPNNITKQTAKKNLGLEQRFVYLFFGRIERYKGVIELISAWHHMPPQAVLLVVGDVRDKLLQEQITSQSNENILFRLGYLPDDQIQLYMNTADIVVFPFNRITTTSSVLLACSFAKTFIAPLKGNIQELPSDIGFFYQEGQDLNKVLNHIYLNQDQIAVKELSAYQYAKSLSWDNISNQTIAIYKHL